MQKIAFGPRKEEVPARKAVPSVFGKAAVESARPKSHIITSLSDEVPPVEDADGSNEIKVIPCPHLLPAESKKGSEEAAVLVLDPVRDGYEKWQENQRLLKEEDLGPKLVARRDLPPSKGLLSRAQAVKVAEAVPGQYGRVPVDDFGMALLLGMGYDPGAKAEVVAYQPKKRAYTKAGIGAEKEFKLPTDKVAVVEQQQQRGGK